MRIQVPVTSHEFDQITARARAAGMTRPGFMKSTALGKRPRMVPVTPFTVADRRQLAELLARLGALSGLLCDVAPSDLSAVIDDLTDLRRDVRALLDR